MTASTDTDPGGSDRHPWQRLHPATPLLRGGIVAVAIIGFVIVQSRDVLIAAFLGIVVDSGAEGQRLPRWLAENTALAVGLVVALILLIIAFGWLSWRRHEYRITDELVEEREGILWRRHRRGRLDRVQGVDVVRSVFPRIFGAARVDVMMAGNEGRIRLAYVGSAQADRLRADILRAASAQRREAAAAATGDHPDALPGTRRPVRDLIAARASEFIAPELQEPVPAESLVHLSIQRLLGAMGLRFGLVLTLLLAVIIGVGIFRPIILIAIIPGVIAVYGFALRELLRSLRYSIAGTPDGIRVGYGLLATTNETLPPGRVHAIELVQPLLWRPLGWWRVRINRASISGRDGVSGQPNTTLLPVGNIDEVRRVVRLVLPGWAEPERFTTSPRRGRWLRWFSWRRNGFAIDERTVVIRRGQLWRTLTVVPLARVQSVALGDGPLTRAMRLARVDVHTVAGVVRAHVGAIDAEDAAAMWRDAETRTLAAQS